jgi:hypothetical protein
MVRRESSPPQRSPSISGKRLRKDMFHDQAPTITRPMPVEAAEGFQDMWNEPLAVLRDTWAATRCLNDHGDGQTKWSPGHLVAIAMWSGGLEAGIQAAKAIRIFGLWSPHVDDEDDALPALSDETRRGYILEKLWPTIQTNQTLLLKWARRSNPGTKFSDFKTAHHHLLRDYIGPDLTKFPAVVRPKLKYGSRAVLKWDRLVTEEQFWNNLTPVLRTHFDPEVDLDAIAQKIQPNAVARYTKMVNGNRINSERKQKAKLNDHCKPSRGINKEIDLSQLDDNEDDSEDFEVRSKDEATVKKESELAKETTTELVHELYGAPRQECPDRKDSTHIGLEEHIARGNAHRPLVIDSTNDIRVNKPSSACGPANDVAVQARYPNLLAHGEPQFVRQQVVNQLYEQTCGISTRTLKSFHQSLSSRLLLPDIWKKILKHRQSNGMWTLGSRDHLPYPRQPSNAPPRPNRRINPVTKAAQYTVHSALRKNVKDDLLKFNQFCTEGNRPKVICTEVIVID